MSPLKLKIDIEYLLPIIDLWTSLVFAFVNGPNNIDLQAYIQQSNHYLDDPDGADYTKLLSDVGPVAYPGGAVYVYTLINLISGRNVTWAYGQYMHIVIDFFRTWLLVKVYKLAYGKRMIEEKNMYVYGLILMQSKYKFCSVIFNFNDTIVHLMALVSIYFHMKSK